jgi:hypothetical protein
MRRHRLINPATTLRRPLPRSLKTDFFNGIGQEAEIQIETLSDTQKG